MHSTPPSEYYNDVWYGKIKTVWQLDGENFLEDVFIRFDIIYERDGRTDRRTPTDGTGRVCIASLGKKQQSSPVVIDYIYYSAFYYKTGDERILL